LQACPLGSSWRAEVLTKLLSSSMEGQPKPPRKSAKQGPRKSAFVRDARKSKAAVSKDSNEDPGESPALEPVKPLDISNGKALFLKYDNVYYNSASLGKWVEATVIMINEQGHIMIDTKEEYWFPLDEQREKIRPCGFKPFQVGEHVQYDSLTQHAWLDCKVIVVDPVDHSIQVSVKEHSWIKVAQQGDKVRYPVRPGFEELIWQAGRMLKKNPPEVDTAERKYRKVLVQEEDNIKALEGLALLLRDYRGDYSQAEACYETALEESPYEMKVLSDYADMCLVQGRDGLAEDLYGRLRRVREKLREFDESGESDSDEGC